MRKPCLSEHQVQAMRALFAFADAMAEGKLSIDDLRQVMKAAITDGRDMLGLMLAMAQVALKDDD